MMKKLVLLIVVTTLVGCGQKAPQVQPNAKTRPVPAGPTSAELSTLEKKHPKAFTNTLGMKFVPVQGTKVQFCIWETRVKDYAAYSAANEGVDGSWKKPSRVRGKPFKQADTHPVVNVSWNDAQTFCEWLTKKELAEGKIKERQKYRLPTDAEWSVAVGLGKEKGDTPFEKDRIMGDSGVYLWGKGFPPPKGAGNYRQSLNVDNFDGTSPVGSFAANKFGLYDMGGNVWEWCEEWCDPAEKVGRVLRGASWSANHQISLLSHHRDPGGYPDSRNNSYGFRCVLASE